MAPPPHVLVGIAGGVATLRLNRPQQYNPLSSAMIAALQRALDELKANPEVRCIVLAANGRAFCAGHDLAEMRAHADHAWLAGLFARCSHLMLTLAELPQPVIASVQGVATAAGCQLVAACDLAIAAESARFATSGINLGLFCSTPAVAVTRTLAPKHAAEMLFDGEFMSSTLAERRGLINRVGDDAALDAETQAWASRIAGKSAAALRSGKALLRAQRQLPAPEAYVLAAQNMAKDMLSDDAQSGIDAFLAKQPSPQWKHR